MKRKLPWAAFIVTMGAALGLRLCQSSIGETWGTVSMVLCAVLLGGGAVCFFSALSEKTFVRFPAHSTLLGVICLAAGALLAGVSVVFQALNRTAKFAYGTGVCTLLAVFAGLVLFLQGSLFLTGGQNFFHRHPLLALLPSLWCCGELVLQFCVNAESAINMENILHTVSLIFLLFTLESMAQMVSGVRRVACGRLYAFGLPAVLATAVSVPSQAGMASFPPGLVWVLLVLAVFTLISLLTLRPMSLEELNEAEETDEEKPEIRPVIRKSGHIVLPKNRRPARRPVVASREDPRPMLQEELDARLERTLMQYLAQRYRPQCYFYPAHEKEEPFQESQEE